MAKKKQKKTKFPKLKFGFYLFCAVFLGGMAPVLGSIATQEATKMELERLQGEGSLVLVEQAMKLKDYAAIGCVILAIIAACFAGNVVVKWYLKNRKD